MSQFWNGEVLAAPNLITVCVDESQASEISGRLYHGYSQEPQSFENVVQLIRYMADFYDSIRFPFSGRHRFWYRIWKKRRKKKEGHWQDVPGSVRYSERSVWWQ